MEPKGRLIRKDSEAFAIQLRYCLDEHAFIIIITSVDKDNYFKLYSYCDIVCKASIQCWACIRIGFFYLYLCTFPFNHIPITPSIDVEHFYSFRNATRSLRILVQPLSHILRNSLGFFFNCEYELIFCLLLSIMGKQFYNILGNCKDCLTDVQKQTHIQYKEESLKAEDLVRSLASL